jgi:hypothetical protein
MWNVSEIETRRVLGGNFLKVQEGAGYTLNFFFCAAPEPRPKCPLPLNE